MLGIISDVAVAGVGLANQYIFFISLLLSIVGFGASIIISQYLGAKDYIVAKEFVRSSMILSVIFGLVLSMMTLLFSSVIINLYSLDFATKSTALDYLWIVGAGSIFVSLNLTIGSNNRVYGVTHIPLIVNVFTIIVNLVGNSIVIFHPFGFPEYGVLGVAVSTLISQFLGFILNIYLTKRTNKSPLLFSFNFIANFPNCKRIMRIGFPTVGEALSNSLAQIVIVSFVSILGSIEVTAYVVILTVIRYTYISSISLGNSTQIIVGYLIGSGNNNEALKNVLSILKKSILLTLVLCIIVILLKEIIFNAFTKNENILNIIYSALFIILLLEPGKTFNLILVPSLRGAGDYIYTVVLGIISTWVVGVIFSYFLGITLGFGLIGIFIGVSLDEWIRGLVFFYRWKTGRWMNKSVIVDSDLV